MSLPAGYPSSLDSLSNPTATTNRDDAGFELDAVIARIQDILEALEAKVGIGASLPTAAGVLHQTAPGVTAWGQVVNGDVSNGAGIVYGKLALANSIQAGDLAAGAAGLTKLGQVSGTGSAAAMEISGIPATYRRLTLIWMARSTAAAATSTAALLTFETTPTPGGYMHQYLYGLGTAAGAIQNVATSNFIYAGTTPAAASVVNVHATGTVNLTEYATAGVYHVCEIQAAGAFNNTASGTTAEVTTGVFYGGTAAFDRVRLTAQVGNWTATSRMTLYGWQA